MDFVKKEAESVTNKARYHAENQGKYSIIVYYLISIDIYACYRLPHIIFFPIYNFCVQGGNNIIENHLLIYLLSTPFFSYLTFIHESLITK
jgi:hypothetical protein